MSSFKRLNDLTGWAVFAVAFVVYLLTVSPTSSFWDCGEFIAVSNELEVPHPPGAPMFLLLGRVFAMLSFGNAESVAYFINLLSVLSSAFTTLFTFWIITYFARRILAGRAEPAAHQTVLILFAGAVGALTATFCTSVWFNAVEAEVYAMSSFFTSVVVWLMLKWDARADDPYHYKWIILIAYLMGVSIGVHLLNLLTIPALAMMFYFRKYPFTWRGFLTANFISVVILYIFNSVIIKKTFSWAMGFERMFTGVYDIVERSDGSMPGTVSGMGMPFGTGALVFTLMIAGALTYGIWYSIKKNNVVLNVSLVSIVMVYLGFSSYAMILIRSNADTPINENNPSNILSFLNYMNREQYGDWPIFYGPMYHAGAFVQDETNGAPLEYKFLTPQKKQDWTKIENFDESAINNRYVRYGYKPEYIYGTTPSGASVERFFPRMHSGSHYDAGRYGYKNYVTDKGSDENYPYDDNPSGLDNLRFFWDYQINYMYIRYFLWNFVGREGDDQGEIDGWESGIFPSYTSFPEPFRSHPSRNHYYALPFLLGLLGLYWHVQRNKFDASVVGFLFFFTGLAIVLYLNQTPQQPRERDYSYAGSFQTFAIWVGLGVIALHELLAKMLKRDDRALAIISGVLCLALVPGWMLAVNFKDHSRAGNYFANDSAYNYLMSLDKDAIVFTNGDNDTFPLWYLQEVENVRPDVRIINLSLLNTDWYIHQLKSKQNQSPPIPMSLPESFYMGEKNGIKGFPAERNEMILPISAAAKEHLVKIGAVSAEDTARMGNSFRWTIKMRGSKGRNYLQKQDLMIMDILRNIAAQDWKRPMYFAISVPSSSFVSLDDYMVLEGMALRVVPVRQQNQQGLEPINRDIMYRILMEKYRFRNMTDPDVFFDSNSRRMASNFQSNYVRLATDYISQAERNDLIIEQAQRFRLNADTVARLKADNESYKEKAKKLIDHITKVIADEVVDTEPYTMTQYASVYASTSEPEKAKKWLTKARTRAQATLVFQKARYGTSIEDRMTTASYQMMAYTYLKDLKDRESALAVSNEYRQYTGSDYILNFLSQQPEYQALPEPQPVDSTTPAPAAPKNK